jgi:hypothetical protein
VTAFQWAGRTPTAALKFDRVSEPALYCPRDPAEKIPFRPGSERLKVHHAKLRFSGPHTNSLRPRPDRRTGNTEKLSDYGVKPEEIPLYAEKTIIKGDVRMTPGEVTVGSLEKTYRSAL